MTPKGPPLFDDIERTSVDWAREGESAYHYLNRTGRIAFERIRRILDRWFSDYPDDAKIDLRSRFISQDTSTHSGAFFELYIHALFCAQGFQVEVHPQLGHTNKSPDFAINNSYGQQAIIECKVVDPDTDSGKCNGRVATVVNRLTAIDSPDFFLWVDIVAEGDVTPSANRIVKNARCFLESLNWEDVIRLTPNSLHDFPGVEIVDGDWIFQAYAIPKKNEARGKPSRRTVGHFGSIEAIYVPSRKDLVRAIEKKATRYGEIGMPYLIAVNRVSPFADEEDVGLAMFGNIGVSFNTKTGASTEFREPNGFWVGPKGPQNKRVSGILEVQQLLPHTISKVTPRLWHNPWASHPFPHEWYIAPQRIPNMEKGEMHVKAGKRGCDILGITNRLLEEPGHIDDGTEGLWTGQQITDIIPS